MRLLPLLSLLFLAACTPVVQKTEPLRRPVTAPIVVDNYPGNTIPVPEDAPAQAPTPTPQPSKAAGSHSLKLHQLKLGGISLTALSFDIRQHQLTLVDKTQGLNSFPFTAAEATAQKNALAALNGGFFTPEGQPLGLVRLGKKQTGIFNSASSLGSGALVIQNNEPRLIRRKALSSLLDQTPDFILQSGPLLLEHEKAISGLTHKEPRMRSFLLSDGKNHFALAQAGPVTLKNLTSLLAKQPLPGFQIKQALNLDGGRSSDFHISSKISGGPLNLRRWWNKPVRNYLLLQKR